MPQRRYSPYGQRKMSRAARAQSRMSRQYPLKRYGRVYVERGTKDNLLRYGTSVAELKREIASQGPNAAAAQAALDARRRDGYIGRGGYIGRSLGGFLGDKVGLGGFGAAAGDKAGDWLWGKTKGWLGMGMYDSAYDGRGAYTSSNALMAGSSRAPPQFGSVQDETGALIVSHREYVGDVFGPDSTRRDFKNRVYEINPGMEATFPWLSQLAQNYEEYELGQLVFEFKSTVDSSVAGDGQVGTVVMVTNYNSEARPFDDKNSMMQYDGSNSCRTTTHAVHGVECDPSKLSGSAGNYIRVKPKQGQDMKTYDHGLFQLATVGMPSNFDNATIGELWVSYTVKLRKPRLFSGKGLNLSRDMYLSNLASTTPKASEGLALAVADTNNIGTQITFVGAVGAAGTDSTGGDSVWPGGCYDITFPSSYSGSVEIRVTVVGNLNPTIESDASTINAMNHYMFATVPGGGSDYSVTGLTGAIHSTGQVDADGDPIRGNLDPINDIFAAFPGSHSLISSDPVGAFSPQWHTIAHTAQSTDANDQDRMIGIAHIRVSVATNGIDNKFRIWLPETGGLSGGSGFGQYAIDISEYNTFDLSLAKAYPTFSKLLKNDGKYLISSVAQDPTVATT